MRWPFSLSLSLQIRKCNLRYSKRSGTYYLQYLAGIASGRWGCTKKGRGVAVALAPPLPSVNASFFSLSLPLSHLVIAHLLSASKRAKRGGEQKEEGGEGGKNTSSFSFWVGVGWGEGFAYLPPFWFGRIFPRLLSAVNKCHHPLLSSTFPHKQPSPCFYCSLASPPKSAQTPTVLMLMRVVVDVFFFLPPLAKPWMLGRGQVCQITSRET